ncbi:queuosine salvage protein [Coccinella septempunctata]|uniref:queuosine salvage protein n=1 Tax=Coccinella septempunctata TaxID=41139 RepID=UPI001D092BA6|nr:queuosine salvage protein [Coccinella septempunctata]
MISPKVSAEYISLHSTNVKIKTDGLRKLGDLLCDEVKSGKLSPSNFSQTELHPTSNDPWALDWILVVDTLNYCFWHNEDELGWRVDGYTGYFALCAAINKAIKNNPQFLDPKFYSTITTDELSKILKSDTDIEIPLLSERVKCLHEVGNVLLEKYSGSFEQMVKEADQSAEKLLKSIVENFKCFCDEANYGGRTVTFYKRAQILVGDIWACFENEGLGHFEDIDKISMFADYRVPQVLVYLDCLEYSDNLSKILSENIILQNGDVEEVEIRGCTIHAVELLKEYILKKLPKADVNSVLIDHFLWDFRRKHAEDILKKKIPFHKTLSIYY